VRRRLLLLSSFDTRESRSTSTWPRDAIVQDDASCPRSTPVHREGVPVAVLVHLRRALAVDRLGVAEMTPGLRDGAVRTGESSMRERSWSRPCSDPARLRCCRACLQRGEGNVMHAHFQLSSCTIRGMRPSWLCSPIRIAAYILLFSILPVCLKLRIPRCPQNNSLFTRGKRCGKEELSVCTAKTRSSGD
jgi:hypothetical protein